MTTYSLPVGSKIEMLGSGAFLKWQKNENGFIVTIPEKIRKLPPSKYVWVLKVTY
jgi:alpha-L-fucosidase